jgi:hypothetical protein
MKGEVMLRNDHHSKYFFCLLALAILFLFANTTFARKTDDASPPVIEIKAPREGEQFALHDYRVNLTFTVTADSLLQEVSAEVVGEHTGIFFSIYEEDQPRYKEDPPVFEFDLYSPIFEGRNILKIIASDKSGNKTEVSTRFYVYPLKSETFERICEPLRVTLPRVLSPKEPVSAPTPPTSPRDKYDLLILTHSKKKNHELLGFGKVLQRLVQHKNNTGMPTILLILDDIYRTPEYRGRDHAEIIKKAIAHAKKKWQIKYVMLIGDCDKFPIRYTKTYDLGHWGHGFAPSDLYYADLFNSSGNFDSWDYDNDNLFGEMQGNFPKDVDDLNQDRINLVPDVAVGRIPVSSECELETYVNKVIHYETTADPNWFKRGLLITGDYPGSNTTNDYVANQLQSQSFQVVKMYHDQIWPTTNLNQRKLMIENELNAGVGFVSYVGHGGGASPPGKDGGVWGGWYHYYMIPFLNNTNKLPVIFSAACDTAMFHSGNGPYFAKWGYEYKAASFDTGTGFVGYRWAPEPIALLPTSYDVDALAEHFLVKGSMGGIAFIGSYTGTQGDSHTLTKYFFEAYASGKHILGDLWNAAISKFVTNVVNQLGYPGHSWHTAARYHHIHKMLLFGDPSLRLGGVLPDLIAVPDQQGNFCRIENGKLVVMVRNLGPGAAGPSTTRVDFFRYGKFTKPTPALDPSQTIQLIFNIPEGCFDPDCEFRITVDAMSEVQEINEGNNSYNGKCIG